MSKINVQVLKSLKGQLYRHAAPNELSELYKLSYTQISNIFQDVKKPFKNICIHGNMPHLLIPSIYQQQRKLYGKQYEMNITIIDYFRNEMNEQLFLHNNAQYPIRQIRYVEKPQLWVGEEDSYDLIFTCLELHHVEEQQMMQRYLRSLTKDGALIGCCFGEGTLFELYQAYLLAENQRSGGLSPKVMTFPPLGVLGSWLTTTHYQLVTILSYETKIQFHSAVDLLSYLQIIAESGYLKGRRKGVFKDVLYAMLALYTTQTTPQTTTQATPQTTAQTTPQTQKISAQVIASLVLHRFIGWKYHSSQPKTLRPGQQPSSLEFVDQLKKYDSELEQYIMNENDTEAKQKI